MKLKLIITSILFFASIDLFACSCGGGESMEEEINRSDIIFVGRVISRKVKTYTTDEKLESGEYFKYKYFEFTILVSEQFKGEQRKVIKIATAKEGATCGMRFKLFKKYVVYGFAHERYGYFTDRCTRNLKKSNRKYEKHYFTDELKDLRKLTAKT
ncbi:hypothetical protein [Chondrinema litorale]|uniref:hypothetical protein n=1 Tax=Chondrinema litorale TaxID=2994555 RepID=UPI002542A263|nr:hypothetical protein [Chondrinema litorale]UZR96175.1 hypothetical protein OQ292_10190 [Chondrinema litorale]